MMTKMDSPVASLERRSWITRGCRSSAILVCFAASLAFRWPCNLVQSVDIFDALHARRRGGVEYLTPLCA